MCWLSIPGLIYLTLAPRFPRTKMFAHPYWILGVNVLYSILWFAAFVAVAAYTNSGVSAGEKKGKKKGCDAFPDGPGEAPKACTLNHDLVGLGVIMWFSWIATTAIAGYAGFYFSQHSVSPFEDLTSPSHDIQETTKDAFSSNDEYAPINRHDQPEDEEDRSSAYTQEHERSASVASSHYDQYGDAHPGRPVSWAADREPYAGIGGHAPAGSQPIAPVPVLPPVSGLSMPEGPEDYGYHGAGGLR